MLAFTIAAPYLEFIVGAIAVGFAALSLFLQRKLSNPKKIREIQRKVNEHTKRLNEMVKSGATREQIQAKQSEIMPHMSEMMKHQIKPVIVIFPLFLLLYWVALPYLLNAFGAATATINFIFPKVSYTSFFIIIEFIIGIAVSIAVMAYDRKKGKAEAAMEQAAAETNS